jgi:hypothetical protein
VTSSPHTEHLSNVSQCRNSDNSESSLDENGSSLHLALLAKTEFLKVPAAPPLRQATLAGRAQLCA